MHDTSLSLLERVRSRAASAEWQRLVELYTPLLAGFRRQVMERQPAAQVSADLGMPLHSVYAAKSRVLAALRAEAGGLVD
ncbi:MAG: hypothetical protein KY476_13335 [Planctomycetes bacterium]|nr:hypothetical protein [Planctomycetota bacterium]